MAFYPIEQCDGCGGAGWITIDHGRIGCPNCNPQPYEASVPSFTTLATDQPEQAATVTASIEDSHVRVALGPPFSLSFFLEHADARALAEWILANTAAATPDGT